MATDAELLQAYAQDRSESAFTELVQRHIDLVYSAALREAHGEASFAEDITQAVFVELAKKASSLVRHLALAGWLYTCVRRMTANKRRSEDRRQRREQEAQTMCELHDPMPDLDWRKLRPVLDEAMHELKEADREAILLRYFEQRPLGEIGARLGVSENTARMRVDRALEKLRVHLVRRGNSTSAAVLSTAISVSAVQTAPAGLAATLTLYLRGDAESKIPVWRMIGASLDELDARAQALASGCTGANVIDGRSMIGGGSLPEESLPTRLVALGEGKGAKAMRMAAWLRDRGVVARIDTLQGHERAREQTGRRQQRQ